MTWRRRIWDNVIRLAIAVWALDWLVVGWKTFVWLDLAAFGAMVGGGRGPQSGRPA